MKKVIISVLAIMLSLTLFGCSKNEPKQEEVEGEITLRIAHNMDFVTIPDAVIEAGNRLNERYAKEGRNLVIKFEKDYQTIDWTEYHNNIVFAHKSEDAPDIYSLDSDIAGFVKAGTLLDISDLITDDFVDGIFTPLMVDGKAYGMPFDLPVRVMYFNKQALIDNGWSTEDVQALPQKIAAGEFTFEQFLDLAKELVDKKIVEYGLAHRPGSGNDFLDIYNVLGGEYFNADNKLVFDSAAVTRFFQMTYDNANVTNITPQNLNQLGWGSINTMVGDGSAFAYYGPMYSSVYVAGAVNKTPEQLVEDVAFALFPVSEYSDKAFATAAPQSMGISSQTKYPEICKDLFEELMKGSNDMLAYHASKIFTLSSIKEANTNDYITTNPVLKEVTYMADYAKNIPSVVGLNIFVSEMHKQIVQLELGLITPEDAVKEFKAQMELNLSADEIEFK